MGLKCAGWTARWKDYKMLCAKLVAKDHKFLWWGTPYKLLRSSTPQIIILIGLSKPFGQNVLWVGAIVKRPGCNYLQLRAGCPRRVPTTLKKFPIMCVFFFDDFTMFLPSLLYWIKFNWAFICLLLFVFHFLILFFISTSLSALPGCKTVSVIGLVSPSGPGLAKTLATRTNRVGFGHLHLRKLYCLHQS